MQVFYCPTFYMFQLPLLSFFSLVPRKYFIVLLFTSYKEVCYCPTFYTLQYCPTFYTFQVSHCPTFYTFQMSYCPTFYTFQGSVLLFYFLHDPSVQLSYFLHVASVLLSYFLHVASVLLSYFFGVETCWTTCSYLFDAYTSCRFAHSGITGAAIPPSKEGEKTEGSIFLVHRQICGAASGSRRYLVAILDLNSNSCVM